MKMKGKLTKYDTDKGFGFITPNGGGDNIFIHKNAFVNRSRTPQVNDIITFSLSKDKHERYCADNATYTGEKIKKKQTQKTNKFSLYLSLFFLALITSSTLLFTFAPKLLIAYWCFSLVTFVMYAIDKSKAKRNQWRISEQSLHMLSLLGGWPGAAFAQQTLRNKSRKKEFRIVYWITVLINLGGLIWLHTPSGNEILALLY